MSTWLDEAKSIVESNGDLGLCVGGYKDGAAKSNTYANLRARLARVVILQQLYITEPENEELNDDQPDDGESDEEESDDDQPDDEELEDEEPDGVEADGEELEDKESDDEKLRCIFWNCGGLLSKLESPTIFRELVISKCPDLIFLSEIKCKDIEVDGDTVIKKLADMLGYACIYTPSIGDQGRSKRGSAILFRKEANGKFEFVINSDRPRSNNRMEAISGTFKFGNVEHVLRCVYLVPPVSDATKNNLINYLKSDTKRTISVGDLNLLKFGPKRTPKRTPKRGPKRTHQSITL
ncbi:unnamed protein product, partial [Mesorhabditis belari]|uniref:Endonuclease/exonuclease/phosphatase domain-containing protein n=1 Tax=Mesorhabditis belari TaxID=2138241 RepID=A0AAF3EKJ7_9BILA